MMADQKAKHMTPEQNEILKSFFTRYGLPSTDCEIRLTGYLQQPEELNELDRVCWYDQTAADLINSLHELEKSLIVYRCALSEQYNRIATAPKIPAVRLKRERRYYENKVYYYLETYTLNLDNGSEIDKATTKYSGVERHKAIDDYNAYVKTHPGIRAEMDIAKSKWER